jgi:regulator of replication initiation timing
MNHQYPTTDPFTDPETTLNTEIPLGQWTSTSGPPSFNALPTSETRITELEKELAESKKREEILKIRNKSLKIRNKSLKIRIKSLKIRIKSLKKAIKKQDTQIENVPAFTLDVNIFNHREDSANEAEAMVLEGSEDEGW